MLDLNAIKSNVSAILTAANTTTGSPIDLSLNMSRRVEKITTLNPARIMQQPSFYPYVSVFLGDKSIELLDISVNQASAKRKSRVDLTIAAGTWNSLVIDDTRDQTDDDLELLMENIELVLRSNDDFTNSVNWQLPISINYHSIPLGEDAHLRIGVMDFEMVNFY